MKLSIITINYNNAKGLRKTIESVISQTSDAFEYIVIDGGSKDGSIEVIQEFEDKITYWVSEADKGIYNAMNKGIQKAKGDYCQFLNSGDWLVSNDIIARMISNIGDCSIFYGNMIKHFQDGKKIRDIGEKGILSMFSFYKGSLNHSPALIKRDLFNRYGLYDESLKIVSDWKFYLIAIGLNNEPVKYIDLDVTCFNMNGISSKNSILEKQERKKVLEEYLPANILADYDRHSLDIIQMKRIKKNKITKAAVGIIERALFKIEKIFKNQEL